eukprot:scaffold64756_cov67-Cyclotella_meneghiniana.AAC.2
MGGLSWPYSSAWGVGLSGDVGVGSWEWEDCMLCGVWRVAEVRSCHRIASTSQYCCGHFWRDLGKG